MRKQPFLLYSSSIDEEFLIYVSRGKKAHDDFVVLTYPWPNPAERKMPTHAQWVDAILKLAKEDSYLALDILKVLLALLKKITPVKWPFYELPKPISHLLTSDHVENLCTRRKYLVGDSKSALRLPTDGFIAAVSLLLQQEKNNYPRGFVSACLLCVLTKHITTDRSHDKYTALLKALLNLKGKQEGAEVAAKCKTISRDCESPTIA